MEIFEQAVRLASDLGVRIIQLAGYDVYYEESDQETRALFAENLRKAVEHAAQFGVLLGFETMETPFLDTVGKGMNYVRAVGSPYLGMYPDLGNLTNAAKLYGLDVAEEIRLGAGQTFAMHLKETEPGKYRDMRFGTGHVDFQTGIRAAREIGVRLFVAECWHDGRADWRGALREVKSFLRRYL
jgi:L-ribulose-5-phosphate 3-epimerase